MTDLNRLMAALAKARDLHAKYEDLEERIQVLTSELYNSDDAHVVRDGIEKLHALSAEAQQIYVDASEQTDEAAAAYAEAETAISDADSEIDDKLSDITVYAEGWPEEIEETVAELSDWLDEQGGDEKSSRLLAGPLRRLAKALSSL